jgi:hypothetical protein
MSATRLPHGYTNDTTRLGGVVTKRYQGPDAAGRQARETAVLRAVAGRLPVPPVLGTGNGCLRLGLLDGRHGQDLIGDGLAGPVLRACGRMLRRVHDVGREHWPDGLAAGPGRVLVHGDYGPNNVLLDSGGGRVTGVLDWEWAHAGDPVEDLAWCEWIVRAHHPAQAGALGGLFDGYGWRPPWQLRHQVMLARHRDLIGFCRRWAPERARLWQDRLAATAAWATSQPR